MFSKIRSDFPIFTHHKDLIYLDSAATTHKPAQVIDAVRNFYEKEYAPVYRSIYKSAERATILYEEARTTVAQFIGSNSHEIAFTKGATEGVNLVAAALENYFAPGDELVLTELEHHSNMVPWQQLAIKKNLIIKYIPINSLGILDLSTLDTIITPKTKLVAVTHCSNVTGIFTDINPIIKRARQVNALLLLDAAQSVPHIKIDVKELDTDFLVFSGHKMLASTGIGVLYAHTRIHELLNPYQTGGSMVYDVDYTHVSWRSFPYKFEAGTPNAASAIGLAAAIRYMQDSFSFADLQKHEEELCRALLFGLQKVPGLTLLGDGSARHLVSFTLETWHAHDIAAYFDMHGIAVRAGHHCAQPLHKKLGLSGSVRISFYVYNTLQEVEKIIALLRAID